MTARCEERQMEFPVSSNMRTLTDDLPALLQELIDALSVYAHLAPKDDSREAAAMVLFQQWIDGRNSDENATLQIHRQMLTKMLDMVRAPTPRRENLHVSRQLVDAYLQEVEVQKKSFYQAQNEKLQITLRLTSDARMLEQLFHIHLDDFLCFYLESLSKAGSNKNSLLAIHFIEVSESCFKPA